MPKLPARELATKWSNPRWNPEASFIRKGLAQGCALRNSETVKGRSPFPNAHIQEMPSGGINGPLLSACYCAGACVPPLGAVNGDGSLFSIEFGKVLDAIE
jgi:hypothetical protein